MSAARLLMRALKARYRDSRAELSTIRRHITSGDIVCDIGANKGSFTYWLSRWVGEDGRVVAFEPQPELAFRLAASCEAARLTNVAVEVAAVHLSSGFLDFFVPDGHAQGGSLNRPDLPFSSFRVPTVSLDQYFPASARVSVLKVDVEGAELAVFAGAERLLTRHKPLLIFECEARHHSVAVMDDVFSFLNSLGYEGHFVAGDDIHPLSAFDKANHQRQDGEWFWKRDDYCNNFIFLHP